MWDHVVIFGASYLYLVIIAVAVITWLFCSGVNRIKLLRLAVIVLPVSYIIAAGLGYVIASPRPFMVADIVPLIPASTDNGFPSETTLVAAAAATVVFVYHRRVGAILCFLACWVGVARVLAQVHHPIDIVGSLVISSLVTYLVYRHIADRIPSIFSTYKPGRPPQL
ncbi:MAG: phosphatase PAP2 family protein [Anaerolineae bacterium]|nr:phosphatase PAP2 family protein [Anaerolineae bacterium]